MTKPLVLVLTFYLTNIILRPTPSYIYKKEKNTEKRDDLRTRKQHSCGIRTQLTADLNINVWLRIAIHCSSSKQLVFMRHFGIIEKEPTISMHSRAFLWRRNSILLDFLSTAGKSNYIISFSFLATLFEFLRGNLTARPHLIALKIYINCLSNTIKLNCKTFVAKSTLKLKKEKYIQT